MISLPNSMNLIKIVARSQLRCNKICTMSLSDWPLTSVGWWQTAQTWYEHHAWNLSLQQFTASLANGDSIAFFLAMIKKLP